MNKPGLVSRIKIKCGICDTIISRKAVSEFNGYLAFKCPTCGDSFGGNYDLALNKAMSYNQAVKELNDCVEKLGVDFELN